VDIANLLLRVSNDDEEARSGLAELAAELDKFDGKEAAAKILLEGVTDVQLQFDDLKKDLEKFDASKASAQLTLDGFDDAKAELDDLDASLDEFGQKRESASLDLNTTEAKLKLDEIKADFEKLRAEMIAEDVASLPGSIGGQAAKAAGTFEGEDEEDGASAISKIGEAASGALTPMSALLALAVALGPALLALVASAAGAVAGFLVLSVSFVGVLAPAIILIIAAVKELTKAWSGVKNQQEAAKASALAIAQAQQGVHSSTQNLSSAQHNLGIQTTEAYNAWKTQLRAVREDLLAVQSAQLGVLQSQLAVKEAQQTLKEFRQSVGLEGGQFDDLFKKLTNVDYDPTNILKDLKGTPGGDLAGKQSDELERDLLNVKQAQLGVKQSQETLHTSSEKLATDRQLEDRYLKEGIKAYPGYIAALKEVQQAQEAMVTAQRTLVKEQDAASHPIEQLSKEQLSLGTALHSIAAGLKALFGPAVSQVLKGLLEGLNEFTSAVKDTALQTAFRQLGKAIGEVFEALGKTLASPEIKRSFTELVRGSSELVKTLGSSIIINFIKIFTQLAVAAMPAMLRVVRDIGSEFKKWADDDEGVDKLRRSIHHIIEEFEDWATFTAKFGDLIGAFFRDISHEGDSLTKSISHTYENWIKFLNTKKGQEEVLKFIKDSIAFGKEFFHVLGTIVTVLSEIIKLFEKIFSVEKKVSPIFKALSSTPSIISGGSESAGTKVLKAIVGIAGHFAEGGVIGGIGYGGGDKIPFMGEAGEFVLRKEIVRAIGVPALNALNQGRVPVGVTAGSGGGGTYIDKIILPPVPGNSSIDPTVAAVKLGRELSKRGLG
jgi:hypothetical protein